MHGIRELMLGLEALEIRPGVVVHISPDAGYRGRFVKKQVTAVGSVPTMPRQQDHRPVSASLTHLSRALAPTMLPLLARRR
jgi:hypothetical protein